MNIVELIKKQARLRPQHKAVVFPASWDQHGRPCFSHCTYERLDRDSDFLAEKLRDAGLAPQSLCLLFVKPSLEFSLLTFALFKIGAVPILIDPGMGLKNLLRAIREVKPTTLIAEPSVQLLRRLFPRTFSTLRLSLTTRACFGLAPSLSSFLPPPLWHVATYPSFPVYPNAASDTAAIVFTSGGTGKPKGVVYTHGIFAEQVALLKELFAFTATDVDMPAFPLFSLLSLAMGVTSVLPPLNPSKPAQANPALLVETIFSQGVTTAAGSPAIWERVAAYCRQHGLVLPTLRALLMFGAPVSPKILADFAAVLPQGDTFTPYGATECLPVACISGKEILATTAGLHRQGRGTCVGRLAPNTEVKIIAAAPDHPLSEQDCQELQAGEIGEILVQGAQVTPRYHEAPQATAIAKIPAVAQTRLWHRMGDLGYKDAEGRLWFCGRKSHRVLTDAATTPPTYLYPIPCEAVFNQHPEVRRSALIGIPKPGKPESEPCLVIEREPLGQSRHKAKQRDAASRARLRQDLRSLGAQHPHTRPIQTFFLVDAFPVDTRHNIKIDRLALRDLCQKRPERYRL